MIRNVIQNTQKGETLGRCIRKYRLRYEDKFSECVAPTKVNPAARRTSFAHEPCRNQVAIYRIYYRNSIQFLSKPRIFPTFRHELRAIA